MVLMSKLLDNASFITSKVDRSIIEARIETDSRHTCHIKFDAVTCKMSVDNTEVPFRNKKKGR